MTDATERIQHAMNALRAHAIDAEDFAEVVRADERARIVAAIRAEHQAHPWSSHSQPRIADMIEAGEFETPADPITDHASPGCACGINGAGERFVDPICIERGEL